LPTIDWFLSPDLMEIEGSESQYTERLIRLPGTGLIWPKPEPLVGERPRSTYGLPDGLLYFVAQNPMKLTPKWDFLYKRIQERTGATIVFADHNVAGATAIAKHRIEMAGIQAHWLTPMPPQDFLRVQQLCDVSLDAPAWSGGNTTLDSLAVGRPVVTLCGDSLRSNHASAFLTLCGLEGLVAHSPEEYVEIATDLDRLRAAMAGFKSEALFERTDGLLELERVIRQTVST
jgi:predicted O-linked N-acetylglucosamine transferase (SPINDLY family)